MKKNWKRLIYNHFATCFASARQKPSQNKLQSVKKPHIVGLEEREVCRPNGPAEDFGLLFFFGPRDELRLSSASFVAGVGRVVFGEHPREFRTDCRSLTATVVEENYHPRIPSLQAAVKDELGLCLGIGAGELIEGDVRVGDVPPDVVFGFRLCDCTLFLQNDFLPFY